MSIDLSALQAPDVIESLDFEVILAEMKAQVVATYPAEQQEDVAAVLDLESEPANRLLQVAAYRELSLRARYNDEARALLLAHATGSDLDHIGVTYYQEERLVVTPADPDATPPVAAVMETDEEYRQRLALKPESYSTAGPSGAYRFHALSAHGQVKAAEPVCLEESDGTVTVYVLSRAENGIPTAEVLQAVEDRLNAELTRPMSDIVEAVPAQIVDYSIDVSLIVKPGVGAEAVLAAAVAGLTRLAASAFIMGGAVARSAIDKYAHQEGVKYAVINAPAENVFCQKSQAPRCTGITVTIGGIEE